jgi:hypothetical protein
MVNGFGRSCRAIVDERFSLEVNASIVRRELRVLNGSSRCMCECIPARRGGWNGSTR